MLQILLKYCGERLLLSDLESLEIRIDEHVYAPQQNHEAGTLDLAMSSNQSDMEANTTRFQFK